MNKVYIFLFYAFLLIACNSSHNNKMYEDLVAVDSLLRKDLSDSALKELTSIGLPADDDRKCKAYYVLLMTQARYLQYLTIDSCVDIDYAIEFYRETDDKEKLARALHWKAGQLCEKGKLLDAIIAEKDAEVNIEGENNPMLCIRVYNMLGWLNESTGNYSLAKEYAFKTLKQTEKTKNKDRIAYSHYCISSIYTKIGKIDSALYYIEKAMLLLDYVKTMKSSIIYQAALCYRNKMQWEKAEQLVKKGMETPHSAAYEGLLGDIYIHTGRADEGAAILQKILPELEGSDKWQAMQLIEDVMMMQKKHEEAARLQEEIMLMKDSIAENQKMAEALAVQKEYESKMEDKKIKDDDGEPWMRYVAVGGVCALMVALFFCGWYRLFLKRRHVKDIMMVKEENGRMAEEITCLNEKLGKDREKLARSIMHGKELYEKLGKEKDWKHIIRNSGDYADFVEYYRTLNPTFVAEKEKSYNGLTPYNLCILIMCEMMYLNDEEICLICGIEPGTLRTQKSRINKRKV